MTDHYLLMTATPHKGDPENFCLFLALLDRDVYGDVKSLEEAMRAQRGPVLPAPRQGSPGHLPRPRHRARSRRSSPSATSRPVEFQIDDDEWDFYDALTRYVEDQSIKAAADDSARGRALGFTMAMLQRRFASSIYAVRRSLERMQDKREKILDDPEAYRQEQIDKKLPDDFDDLPDEEQQEILAELEDVVASVDPAALREEILELDQADRPGQDAGSSARSRSKLVKLREVLTEQGVFNDPKMKLLIFTEHKDTLDYLRDGKTSALRVGPDRHADPRRHEDRRPRHARARASTPSGSSARSCQVLVATEAAGEGINLQFCWFMINYDIPWNPVRLEQRMGRIHRYGQEKDCLIFNFVSHQHPRRPGPAEALRAASSRSKTTSTRSAPARSSTSWATSSRPTSWSG